MIRNRQHVFFILRDYPETRDNDLILIDRYINIFFKGD
jgi:hypothetical protein